MEDICQAASTFVTNISSKDKQTLEMEQMSQATSAIYANISSKKKQTLEMEEMRQAASAFYANISEEGKQLAKDFFKEMDANGSGNVSITEFVNFVKDKEFGEIANADFFKALDKDHNGSLDFNEALLVYYIYTSGRMMFCKGCRCFLKGVYFTCVECFCLPADQEDTFDLCCNCYRDKNYDHLPDHATFLDNYALLRTKRIEGGPAPTGKGFRKMIGGLSRLAAKLSNSTEMSSAAGISDQCRVM